MIQSRALQFGVPVSLTILYQDEHLVAVDKPSGLLVHRSVIDRHETRFAMQEVRNQLGRHVFPLHRLDKPTSGVLLFALSSDTARQASEIWSTVQKHYLAITRGHAPVSGHIDHALREELDKMTDRKAQQDKPAQEAQTDYSCLAQHELQVTIEKYPCSRFSLLLCRPNQGRKHQIRRHLKHINHPIIGDAKHGRGRYNRYFRDNMNCGRLLLHAVEIELIHPVNGQLLTISAPVTGELHNLLQQFNWLKYLPAKWSE